MYWSFANEPASQQYLQTSVLERSRLDVIDGSLCVLHAVKEHQSAAAATVDVRRRDDAIATELLGEVLLRDRVVDVGQPHTERRHAATKPQLQQHHPPLSLSTLSYTSHTQNVGMLRPNPSYNNTTHHTHSPLSHIPATRRTSACCDQTPATTTPPITLTLHSLIYQQLHPVNTTVASSTVFPWNWVVWDPVRSATGCSFWAGSDDQSIFGLLLMHFCAIQMCS